MRQNFQALPQTPVTSIKVKSSDWVCLIFGSWLSPTQFLQPVTGGSSIGPHEHQRKMKKWFNKLNNYKTHFQFFVNLQYECHSLIPLSDPFFFRYVCNKSLLKKVWKFTAQSAYILSIALVNGEILFKISLCRQGRGNPPSSLNAPHKVWNFAFCNGLKL